MKEPKEKDFRDEASKEREDLIQLVQSETQLDMTCVPPTTSQYYSFLKMIGKGAFGKVILAVHRLTGRKVAIKSIGKRYMKDEFQRRKVFQEVYILKKI